MEIDIEPIKTWLSTQGLDFLINLVVAALIFLIGRWISRAITKFTRSRMEKANVDAALVSFVSSLLYATLLILVILAALGQLGIKTTGFVAILGAAGLAVGLALQGSLSNFAAGVLIIMFRPFRVGDVIEAGGALGAVQDITILTTVLHTPDNRKIIVPNSAIMGGNIVNITANETRRCDMVFGVGYNDDLQKVQSILEEIVASDERCLKDPAPTIVVGELADSSVNFFVRPWVKKEDYWGVYFDMHRKVKERFDKEGISIPFPQRDVHLFQEGTSAAG